MKDGPALKPNISIELGGTHITLGPGWLAVIPAGLWFLATLYVPLLSVSHNPLEIGATAVLIALLIGLSLAVHVLAHLWSARRLGVPLPARLPVHIFGDASQAWPAGRSPARDALAAVAAPAANLVCAGVAYLVWNVQLNAYLNTSMPMVGIFNLGIAALNLLPGFPLDGGRVTRAIAWGVLGRARLASHLASRLGLLIAAALAGWGIFLALQRERFGLETGAATLALAALILLGLKAHAAWDWDPDWLAARPPTPRSPARLAGAGALILTLLLVGSSVVPVNMGIQAPGVALPVEPMVEVPPAYRHPSSGAFILTSVLDQAPIVLGAWVYGRLSPSVRLVPTGQIYPPGVTPQDQARQGFEMLDESEVTASVVGLRLAGYNATAAGKGVRIGSVLAESPSRGLLRPGDIIQAVNGQPVHVPAQLTRQIAAQRPDAQVRLEIDRDGHALSVLTSLLPAQEPGGPPRLGITVESAGLEYRLPFPVTIVPQKIVGGPSAGLMFTLTVYDLVTPGDLTGGRKIAGTGTIDPDGTVGPIGGVEEKVVAAEDAGAAYFLAPSENYQAARAAARRIQVVEVSTAQGAVDFLRDLGGS